MTDRPSPRRRLLALVCVSGLALGALAETVVTAMGADEPARPVITRGGTAAMQGISGGVTVSGRFAGPQFPVQTGATSESAVLPSEVGGRIDGEVFARSLLLAAAATALLGLTLLESLLFAVMQGVRTPRLERSGTAARLVQTRPLSEAEYEQRCQQLFQTITTLWARAETSVLALDEALPLRSLLHKEMRQIQQRLAMDPAIGKASTPGALTARHEASYWRSLSQRLNQSARDLNRIGAVAEAAGAGFGGANSEPRIPKTRDEACFILGANREADGETLQRLVKALRQCWHPDLAQTDADRRHREARIKQINAAHDLITGKRVEG